MYNKVILMGRLTGDPELKTTPNNIQVTSFSIAVQRTAKKDVTDFINIVAWRSTADFICKYFKKGQMILVDGEIQTRNYTDNNNVKRYVFEIMANNVSFCDSKKSDDGIATRNVTTSPYSEPANDYVKADTVEEETYTKVNFDDDLPF